MTDDFYRDFAGFIEQVLKQRFERRMGFALLVFDFTDKRGAGADYISNANREDMLKFMQETLDRLRAKEDLTEGMPSLIKQKDSTQH